ncbi:hypothetical protein J5751_06180 [bacterium]|nr:hypothetical protein [bacterium]
MDNYIAYEPKVQLDDPFCRKTKFSPYSGISISVSEVHYCPFCGEVYQGTSKPCCEDFVRAYLKLLLRYKITDLVHHSIGNDLEEYGSNVFHRPVTEIQSRVLKKSEVKRFDADFWDFSEMYSVCGDVGFRLANPSFEGGELKFYWKNLKTKKVHLCSLQDLKINAYEPIFLRKCSWINDYPKYENLVRFEDWNKLCEVLKEL